MGPFTSHLQPGAVCETAESALADSVNRLKLAAETVDDESTSALLDGLAADRDENRSTLVRVAADSGLELDTDQSGSLSAAIGDGWMQLEGALDGDADVVVSVRREEDNLVDTLARVLETDLPSEVEEVIRAAAGGVAEGLERLDRLPRG